jgi:hypothetical protein
MIDDFKVPGDAGYGHDDYGRGKSLSMHDFGAQFERLAPSRIFRRYLPLTEPVLGAGA